MEKGHAYSPYKRMTNLLKLFNVNVELIPQLSLRLRKRQYLGI